MPVAIFRLRSQRNPVCLPCSARPNTATQENKLQAVAMSVFQGKRQEQDRAAGACRVRQVQTSRLNNATLKNGIEFMEASE
eukprot:CAMPEP_0194711920 /NCGR_PEP_ID=MMETSP0296-20130528/4165_1 /TAXON_ID=39354 /ORGANISM="Heterosigma akashiwo, Strain CCMP2393" /LENGTH=80 /DNA_ID=CAMNT_0039610167 /DNA_START=676 /DNA_END=918 /DNA_ORIENTATION=+